MTAQTQRSPVPDPRDPISYQLSPIRFEHQSIQVRLTVRWAEGGWRGRLGFLEESGGLERETAEIFRGDSATELWQSVSHLREHHVRDLYRSLL
jgi:hypothetical protein